MQQTDYPLIVIDPEINNGQPTIKGTLLTVQSLLEQIANGRTFQKLFEEYPELPTESIGSAIRYMAEQRKGKHYPCPCCGYLVFDKPPGSYDICDICFWEDDSIQSEDPLLAGGANHVSLMEGQQNYLAFGACEERLKEFVRPPLPGERQAEEWRPVDPDRDILEKPFNNWKHRDRINCQFQLDPSCLYYWSPTYWRRVMRPRQDLSSQQTSPSNEEKI